LKLQAFGKLRHREGESMSYELGVGREPAGINPSAENRDKNIIFPARLRRTKSWKLLLPSAEKKE